MMAFACGPYEVPNVEVNTYAVHTNNNPSGAFRGYGSPQVAFAAETHLQHMIDVLGLDPIETRLKNALDYGKATITGDVLTEDVGAGMVQCLSAVKEELSHTILPKIGENERIGVGIACAYKNVGLGINVPDRASAQVSLEPDGKFLVRHGGTDMGQGSNHVVATIASRVLGVPVKDIRVHTGDTREDPHGGITTASRATFVTGNAAKEAAEGLRTLLWDTVSKEFNFPPELIEIKNGAFCYKETGDIIIRLPTLAKGDHPFNYTAEYEAPQTKAPSEMIPAYPDVPAAPLHFAYDFGAQAAILSVNIKTGKIKVHKIIAAHDSGEPIIYKNVIGQIEGAVIQGLGYALSEKFEIEDGIPKSIRLRDLGLLRFRDIPEIVAIPITDPHPKGPFGAKGMGELALSPTAPAVINAIHNATGVWVRELPATREWVKEALANDKS
jgi:CO/xanthine dehydrogenase Mo-binding subunit